MTGPGGTRAPADASSTVRRRALIVVTGLLAVAAAIVVVVSDDARWLRVAVVAALWATLLVGVTVGRRGSHEASEALRQAYEAELAGEVEARREHEVAVERQIRRELAAERSAEQEEIAALRGEVERLRVLQARVPEPHLRVVGGTSGPLDAHPHRPAARPTPPPAAPEPPPAPVRPLRPVGSTVPTAGGPVSGPASPGGSGPGSGPGGVAPIRRPMPPAGLTPPPEPAPSHLWGRAPGDPSGYATGAGPGAGPRRDGSAGPPGRGLGSGELGSGELGSGGFGSGGFGSGELGSGEFGPGEFGPGVRRAGRVDPYGVALNGSAVARGRGGYDPGAAPQARTPEWSDPTGRSFAEDQARATGSTGSRTVAELLAAHAAERERRGDR